MSFHLCCRATKVVIFLVVFSLVLSIVVVDPHPVYAENGAEQAAGIGDPGAGDGTVAPEKSTQEDGSPGEAADIEKNFELEEIAEIAEKYDIGIEPEKAEGFCSEFSTAYINEDGTVTVKYFLAPVNYYDKNNDLQEIKCDLEVVTDPGLKQQGFMYNNKSGPVAVRLPENIVSDVPVKIDNGKYSISIRPAYAEEEIPAATGSPRADRFYRA
jgi:hypothetical protein